MKRITLFVIAVHFLIIGTLLFSRPKKLDRPKHIAVRTIQPSLKPRSTTTAAAAPTSRKKQTPVSTKKESPKAAPSKPSSKSLPATSKPINQKKPAVVEKGKSRKPVKAKAAPPAKIWHEIDEALAKIDDKAYPRSQSKLDVPQVKSSPTNQIPFPDFESGSESGTHEETLISFLHASLNLPEFGEVKIQMTINKDGSVAKLVVLESESQKNKVYLQQHLPRLKFPLIFDNDKTITLTFCNEI